MSTTENRAISIPLHNDADTAVEACAVEFADTLLLQSKVLATLDSVNEVQSKHVLNARNIVMSALHMSNRKAELLRFIGNILLGVTFTGFITEYQNSKRADWFIGYFVLGIIATVISGSGFRGTKVLG